MRNSGLHLDSQVEIREDINREEKIGTAEYAVSLIEVNDLAYMDSGTATGMMIDFLKKD